MIVLKQLVVILSLGISIAPCIAQTTIHVPADVPTIQSAIDHASNGDTVLVAPGTYTENINFKGKAITVTSGAKVFADAASTVIIGATDGPVVVFGTNEPSTAVLNGFTVQNGHASSTSELNGGGISISNASPTITNNIVTNNVGCGIFVFNLSSPLIQGNDIKGNHGPGSTTGSSCLVNPGRGPSAGAVSGTGLAIIDAGNVQIIGNTIEENVLDENNGSPPCFAGLNILNGSQILLENNIIRNNQAQCSPGLGETIGSPAAKLTMIQNLIYGNTSPSASVDGVPIDQVYISGTYQAPYASIMEIDNTIYGGGQQFELGFASSTVANNIFVNTSNSHSTTGILPAGAWCGDASIYPYPELAYNDIFNTGTLLSSGCPIGAGNLAVDPQFLNTGGSDFHTQPTSPVVAAGDINAPDIPPADLDGKARTVDNTIDMGVYEVRPHPPIVLNSSPNPAPGQSSVTLTAVLTGNRKVPTGLVTFLDGATILGTAPLNGSGTAIFSTAFLFVGTHNIVATYPGDFNFEDSTSNVITEVITGPPTTTALLSVSPNPAHSLQSITMNARVSSSYTIPTGTISFFANGNTLATAPVNANGLASATVSTLTAGTYGITAGYGGSTEYAASTSNSITESVVATNTITTLIASPNPSAPAQPVTFTAAISSTSGTGTPTGTVTFKDGANTLATISVGANGVASFTTSALQSGTHLITAYYGGSQNFNSSSSAVLTVAVTAMPTSIALNVSPNPANVGQNVALIATAVSGLPNLVPSGTVTFSDQSGVLGTASLVAGVASFSTTSLSVGSHQLTAVLNPTGLYASSKSAIVSEVITNYNFSMAISSTSLIIPSGDHQILTVTLTPSGGFPGSVALSCSSLPAHAQCSFDPATSKPLSGGPQTVNLWLDTSDVLGYGQGVKTLTGRNRPVDGNASSVFTASLFPMLALWGLMGVKSRRINLRLRRFLLVFVLAGASMSLVACSGRLPGSTEPGNYVVTVTATGIPPGTGLVQSVDLHFLVTK